MSSAPELRSVVLHGSRTPSGMLGWQAFVDAASSVDVEAIELSRSRLAVRDIAMMMYTSGTTAMPKGCPITYEALVRPAVERR